MYLGKQLPACYYIYLIENDFYREVLMMCICDLKPSHKCVIDTINGNEKLMKRLLALGCTQGTEVVFKTTDPFGDPLIFNLRGFDLALRKKEVSYITLK
jgi:ferrous iron transport protein A